MAKTSNIVSGLRPVIEAINSHQRIDRIFLQNGLVGSLVGELRALIKQYNLPTQYVPVEKLNRMTQSNHQGVVATISPVQYESFVDVMERLAQREQPPFVVLLDHITDVRNMGAIVRTAECAGVDAVVVPEAGSAQIGDDAIKSSSGALLRMTMCREQNLKTVLNLATQYGLQVVAATEHGSVAYTQIDFCQPTLLIMGAEQTGVSPDLLRLCQQRAAIPIRGEIESLNVSVAAGVMMYEVVRQRADKA